METGEQMDPTASQHDALRLAEMADEIHTLSQDGCAQSICRIRDAWSGAGADLFAEKSDALMEQLSAAQSASREAAAAYRRALHGTARQTDTEQG